MMLPPATMSASPPPPAVADRPPFPPLAWWQSLLLTLGPVAFVATLVLARGDLLLAPSAIATFHAVLLQQASVQSGSGALLWDMASILGGYPIYAAAQSGAYYPGFFLFAFLRDPLMAWNGTLLLHFAVPLLLFAQRFRQLTWPLIGVWLWLAVAPDAYLLLQAPLAFCAMPWICWAWCADVGATPRPTSLRLAHWMLCTAMACTLGPEGAGVALLGAAAYGVVQRDAVPAYGCALGLLLGAFHLAPWIATPEVRDWSALGQSLVLAVRPAATLALCLLLPQRWRWWPVIAVCLLLLALQYEAWYAGTVAAALILGFIVPRMMMGRGGDGQLGSTERKFLLVAVTAMLVLMPGSLKSSLIEKASLVAAIDATRGVIPRSLHVSLAVIAPETPPLIPVGEPAGPMSSDPGWHYLAQADGPLLWNLAPDRDLAAASVAVPWSPRWREQLATVGRLHQPAAGQKIVDLIRFEYFSHALGLTLLSGVHRDLPMLEYRRIDAAHPGQLPQPPSTEDAEFAALQDAVMERLTVPGDAGEVPAPPQAWQQQPVAGRAFYQARGVVPYALLGERTPKALGLDPAPWPALQLKALEKLQIDTGFPYFENPRERTRYLVLADDSPEGTVLTPATIVADRGRAVEVRPQLQRTADGLTLRLQVPATDAPWVILRQSLATGWTATMNGQEVAIARADGVWMALPLPQDQAAEIELRYTVPGLRVGQQISAAMALIWLLLGVAGWRAAGRFSSVAEASPTDAAQSER